MIKVMIADDEAMFRAYLSTLIDWNAHGFTLCGAAENGAQALELARETQPDIALLDINMPKLDGISLTQRLVQELPQLLIVYVTGHSEFEYVRRALQLGVEDYLLKPFSKEELLELLSRLQAKLAKQWDDERYRKLDGEIVKEELLLRLVEQHGAPTALLEQLERVGLAFPHPYFCVAALEFSSDQSGWRDLPLWQYGIANIAGELLSKVCCAHVFSGSGWRLLVLLNLPGQDVSPGVLKSLQSLCAWVERCYHFGITVGLGTIAAQPDQIHTSYQNALTAAGFHFTGGAGQIILFNQIPETNRSLNIHFIELNRALMQHLRQARAEDAAAVLQQVLHSLLENTVPSDWAKFILVGLLSTCVNCIAEHDCSVQDILGPGSAPYRDLEARPDAESAIACLQDICQTICLRFGKKQTPRVNAIIENVRTQILEHYGQPDLSVERIAENLYLDASYIRKLFARYQEGTVSDLITSVRLEKAAELLKTTDAPLGTVAEQVGYTDPGYFGRCFKKTYGITPSLYRRQVVL